MLPRASHTYIASAGFEKKNGQFYINTMGRQNNHSSPKFTKKKMFLFCLKLTQAVAHDKFTQLSFLGLTDQFEPWVSLHTYDKHRPQNTLTGVIINTFLARGGTM